MTYPPQKQTGDVIDTGLFDLHKGNMQKLQRKSKNLALSKYIPLY